MKTTKIFIGEINLKKIKNSLYFSEYSQNETNYKIALYHEYKEVIDNIVDIVNKIRENNTNCPEGIKKTNIIEVVEKIMEAIRSKRRNISYFSDIETSYDSDSDCVNIFFVEFDS